MSLIGGYFRRSGKLDDAFIEEKVKSFSIIPGDEVQSYETIVHESQFGHIIGTYKKDAPPQIKHCCGEKCAVITLGFPDLGYGGEGTDDGQRFQHASFGGGDPAKEIEKSEGEFVSIVLDRDSGNVHIINDRFASRPFYILESADIAVFSSNLFFLLHLAERRQSPDLSGWLQIFSYGHTLGERTNLKDVKRIMPASHVIISRDEVRSRQYWRLQHDVHDDLDPVVHAEKTFAALRESTGLRSRLVNKGFASLSGGLDSRLVAGALPEAADFFTFTFTDSAGSETAEVVTAREVSRILNREHRVVPIGAEEVSSAADCLIGLTGGLTPIHHPAKSFSALREMIACWGFKMGGGPGDVLAGAYVAPSIHNIRPVMTDRQVYKFIVWRRRHSMRTFGGIFRHELLAEHFGQLDASMQECFATLSGPTAAHKLTAWAMIFRQPAFTFTSPIHNHPDVTEASPHLGYGYADCMLQLPAAWIYLKNFYKFMIYHCLPDLRQVIYANTGQKLTGRMEEFTVSNRKRFFGAVERMLAASPLERYRMSRTERDRRASFEYDMI